MAASVRPCETPPKRTRQKKASTETRNGNAARAGDLAGFTVGITADRRADEQADLLQRRGAEVRFASALSTRPLLAGEELTAATTRVIDDAPDLFVANTAIGILAWLAAAEASGVDGPLLDRLRQCIVLARGPKSAGALRQVGIEPSSIAPTERLAAVTEFAMTVVPPGAHVVVQLDGGGRRPEIDRLRTNGYRVTTIGTYRWDEPDDPAAVVRMVQQAVDGAIDALTFTSPPAVRQLAALADAHGLGDALRGEASPVIACVGPVTADAARAVGLTRVASASPGRMGLMVRALADALEPQCRHLVVDARAARVQGRRIEVGDSHAVLSRLERAVFDVLADRSGSVVAVPELLQTVWGSEEIDVSTLHAAIARLRHRLQDVGLEVQVVRRRGYRLVAA